MCVCVCVYVVRWVAMQDKGLSAGERAAPSLLLSLAWSTGTSPWVCVCESVGLRVPVWGWIQPGARWPAVNYELLINLGKGTDRLWERVCDKCPSIFDVTGLNLSALLVGFGLTTGLLKTHRRDKELNLSEKKQKEKQDKGWRWGARKKISNILSVVLLNIIKSLYT